MVLKVFFECVLWEPNLLAGMNHKDFDVILPLQFPWTAGKPSLVCTVPTALGLPERLFCSVKPIKRMAATQIIALKSGTESRARKWKRNLKASRAKITGSLVSMNASFWLDTSTKSYWNLFSIYKAPVDSSFYIYSKTTAALSLLHPSIIYLILLFSNIGMSKLKDRD